MKLKVPKNTLDKAIKSVAKAIPSKGIQPILNNIYLENQNGHLVLNATDLDLFIEAKIPSSNEETGAITLSARKLEEIVSKLEEDDVNISVDHDNSKANLVCKKANFDLIGISPEDFPKLEKPESQEFFELGKEKFAEIIDKVHFAASRYDNTNILSGVYLGLREENGVTFFDVAATDGNRLASFSVDLGDISGTFVKKEVVVPVKVIADVQKILDTSVDDVIKIAFLSNQIVFKTEDRFVVSRLLEGVYPRYKQLIPEDTNKMAQVDRQELLSCLERVSVMANERTNLVTLKFDESNLYITTSNLDFGGAEDNISIEYMGEPLEIAFNVKYLIDGIKCMDSDKIQISMNEALNPALVKPISDQEYIYLIMPIKSK